MPSKPGRKRRASFQRKQEERRQEKQRMDEAFWYLPSGGSLNDNLRAVGQYVLHGPTSELQEVKEGSDAGPSHGVQRENTDGHTKKSPGVRKTGKDKNSMELRKVASIKSKNSMELRKEASNKNKNSMELRNETSGKSKNSMELHNDSSNKSQNSLELRKEPSGKSKK